MLFEVLYSILAQPALSAADQSLDEVFGFLRHIRDVGWKLKSLLGVGVGDGGHEMKTYSEKS